MRDSDREFEAMDKLDHGIRRIRNLSVVGVLAFDDGDGQAAALFAAIGEYLDEVEEAQAILQRLRRADRDAAQALLAGPKAGAVVAPAKRRQAIKRG